MKSAINRVMKQEFETKNSNILTKLLIMKTSTCPLESNSHVNPDFDFIPSRVALRSQVDAVLLITSV